MGKTQMTKAVNNPITIGLAGDVMIGRLVNECLKRVPPCYLWGDVLSSLQTTDCNLINLEAALTLCEKKVCKTFNFKSDPKHVAVLTEGAISAVNLANNHILDYSEEGLLDTLEALDHAKIQHVGAGKNKDEAIRPVIIHRHGITIGILGCTDNEPSWAAKDIHPGIFYLRVGDVEKVLSVITKLRSEVDILIFSMHWGPNMQERPLPHFQKFAHDLIDIGVDVFHGHSAHIFQGVEVYKNKLILYDTGDFVDDYAIDPFFRNDRSFFFILSADR